MTPDLGTPTALSAAQLYRHAEPSALNFQTTAELVPIAAPVGQDRALGAIKFGTQIRKSGFNLFVIGSAGSRMQDVVESILRRSQSDQPAPSDWVYVNNFEDSRRPIAIQLPPGRAVELRDTLQEVINDLKIALPALFESEDYQARRAALDQTFEAKQSEAFAKLGDKAAAAKMALVRTPMGFMIAPVRDGNVIPPDEFNAWPEADRAAAQDTIENLQRELEQIIRHVPAWKKEHRDEVQKLERQTALVAIDQGLNDAKVRFSDIPRVVEHLDAVRADLIENLTLFVEKPQGDFGAMVDPALDNAIDRYLVNVLVDHATHGLIPIVQEFHPTLGDLIIYRPALRQMPLLLVSAKLFTQATSAQLG